MTLPDYPAGWWEYQRFRDEFTALDPERYPPEWIDGRVWAGFWRCLGTDHAAILFELKAYPSGFIELHGIAAAGNLKTIVDLIDQAVAWGRANGARRAVIQSREGWRRMLPDWETHQIDLRKEL